MVATAAFPPVDACSLYLVRKHAGLDTKWRQQHQAPVSQLGAHGINSRTQAFASPQRLAEMVAKVRAALSAALPEAVAKMKLYLNNPATHAVRTVRQAAQHAVSSSNLHCPPAINPGHARR